MSHACRVMLTTASAACLLSVTLTGCGGPAADAPTLVDAYGKVTVDGSPTANARVMFVSTQGSPAGVTDADGDYTIEYNDKQNGAFPGATTVVIKQMSAADFSSDPDADDEDDDADFDRQEAAAASNANLEWQVKLDVKEGGGPFNFDLKSEDAGKTP